MSHDYDPMFDEEFPCEVCGKMPDDCICPECPECGAVGDPKCYDLMRGGHGLVRTPEQIKGAQELQAFLEQEKEQDRQATEALIADLQWEKDHAEEIKKAIYGTPEE